MSWLFEQPVTIAIAGAAIAAATAFFWLQTGHRHLIYLFLIVLLLTGVLLGVERIVETDREQVASTLHHIAQLVQENRKEDALQYLHLFSVSRRQEVEAGFDSYQFERVRIKQNLDINVEALPGGNTAAATFNAVVSLSRSRPGLQANQPYPVAVSVQLVSTPEGWKVVEFDVRYALARFRM